jgi:hypothetical protein
VSYCGPDVERELFYEMRRQQQWRTYGTGLGPSPYLAEVLLLASLEAAVARPRLAKRRRHLAALTRRMEQNP